jgi:hypothetical protein
MGLEFESRSAGLSNADAFRGAVTAAASNPPVVVMKFLRLREYDPEFWSIYVPRQISGLEDQVVAAESAETVFWLPQHYTQGNVNMAGKPLVRGGSGLPKSSL